MATIDDFNNTKELSQYHESMRTNYRGDNNQLVDTVHCALERSSKNDNQQDSSSGFVLGYN